MGVVPSKTAENGKHGGKGGKDIRKKGEGNKGDEEERRKGKKENRKWVVALLPRGYEEGRDERKQEGREGKEGRDGGKR